MASVESRAPSRRFIWARRALLVAALLAVSYALLLIPESRSGNLSGARRRPFVWNRDALWQTLEARFDAARRTGCDGTHSRIDAELTALDLLVKGLEEAGVGSELTNIGQRFFSLGADVAACTQRTRAFVDLAERMRATAKDASHDWEVRSPAMRATLYQALYGARAAVEEVLLQQPPLSRLDSIVRGVNERSMTPGAVVEGVELHSGDLLVSRGGAPTSALIARGNDYPGNFSHIALVHIDPTSHVVSMVEAHIERGVAIATQAEYLRDKKLRIVVLRLRADLPAMVRDPMIPHRAAEYALLEARRHHIPYDFEMDTADDSKQFCSEVASASYRRQGIELWRGLSSMSSPGLVRWLGALGVTHFTTHAPADLEYDSQLRVVAEWRDPTTLFKDHVDNAVIDALLETAERGATMEYDPLALPLVRAAKGYSALLNMLGKVGPVPEGMSATAALRTQWLSERHRTLVRDVLNSARAFRMRHGYQPPYWRLVDLARRAVARHPV